MILAILYFLVFSFFIYRSPYFNDSIISKKTTVVFFTFKCLSAFLFVFVYGIDVSKYLFNGDTQSIMQDAGIIFSSLIESPADYFKIVFGFYDQSDFQLFEKYLNKLGKWEVIGNNSFNLNDSKGITRVNAFLMLFTLGKYEVHALFMCFLSFSGLWLLYKSFKDYFLGKELILFFVLFLIPSVFFWTGGVLKEPITVFSVGLFSFSCFRLLISKQLNWLNGLSLAFSIFLFLLIKPYVLLLLGIPFFVFFMLRKKTIRFKIVWYSAAVITLLLSGAFISKSFFKRDLIAVIVTRQNDFVSTSYGGAFFYLNERYIRVDYKDIERIKPVNDSANLYRLDVGIDYMYWDYPNFKDTFYVKNNADTSTLFPLINITVPSNSILTQKRMEPNLHSLITMIPVALANTFLEPNFINDRTIYEKFASIENLLLLTFFLFALWFSNFKRLNKDVLILFVLITFLSFLLIGLTTTLSGAIVRYKVPFLPFLWMIPLLIIDIEKVKKVIGLIRKK